MAQVWAGKPARAGQGARRGFARGLAWLFALAEADSASPGGSGARSVASSSAASDPTGDYDAFVREHERVILNYLWRMTGDEQSAYDLTQEVFLRAWQRFARLQNYEKPEGWLFRVATNLGLTALARWPESFWIPGFWRDPNARVIPLGSGYFWDLKEQRLVTTSLGWTRTASQYIVATPAPRLGNGQPMDSYTLTVYDTSAFATP